MQKHILPFIAVALSCAVSLPVLAGTVTGQNGYSASIYANPFDSSLDFSNSGLVSSYGDSVLGTVNGWLTQGAVSGAVSRQDGREYFAGNALMYKYGASASDTTFLQYTAPSVFDVGTIITVGGSSYSGYTGSYGFDLMLSDNPSIGTTDAAWTGVGTTVSGIITGANTPISVYTLPTILTNERSLRVRFNGQSSYTPGGYVNSGMKEVMLLPDQLERVVPTNVTVSAGGNLGALWDMQGGDNIAGSGLPVWYDLTANPLSTKFAQFDFGRTNNLTAMILGADQYYEHATINIRAWIEGNWLTVAQSSFTPNGPTANPNGNGEWLPIKFDTAVSTDKIRLEWVSADPYSGGTITSLREVMFFIPEPSSLTLLGLGGLLLLRRRKAWAPAGPSTAWR